MAPFLAGVSSELDSRLPHWLLKNDRGKSLQLRLPGLEEPQFVLDFHQKEVQDFLTNLLYKITQQWAYDILFFEGLYTVSLAPPPNKTQGQVMSDAMRFLRKRCEGKYIVGNQIPIGAALTPIDYLADGPINSWENNWLTWNRLRERHTAIAMLTSRINRHQLYGRFFRAGPLRVAIPGQKSALSLQQEQSCLLLHSLTGGGLLIPYPAAANGDDQELSAEQLCEWRQFLSYQNARISKVEELAADVFGISFTNNGEKWMAFCNLRGSGVHLMHQGQPIDLEGFESLVLKDRI